MCLINSYNLIGKSERHSLINYRNPKHCFRYFLAKTTMPQINHKKYGLTRVRIQGSWDAPPPVNLFEAVESTPKGIIRA